MGWTAGLYLSDFLDRNIDLIQKPHRPIPSGRIKPSEALVIGGIFAITGLILSEMHRKLETEIQNCSIGELDHFDNSLFVNICSDLL